ncbi:SBA1 [Candida pseudojiufengensis]|uniref:SBA1 n=1 Tax=Candida pseudojiufengensis TaxID=497109 RepID=UPI00222588D1|nr:SBA1 [Candida pseudojiufengensis]KAI5963173.1 SBA1 [Candida pseudojiufengensis]
MSVKTQPPTILWAQRSSKTEASKNVIYLTIEISDPKDLNIDLKPTTLKVTADSSDNKIHYDLNLEFYKEINVEDSKINTENGQKIFIILQKKELEEEYWPRLTKDKIKYHFIKTDFDKWVDEDEQNEVNDDQDDMMAGMQGLGGGAGGMPGMPGMPGMGGAGGPGGMDFSQLLSQMGGGAGGPGGQPDLSALASQLGAAGGAGGPGGLDFSSLGGLGGAGDVGEEGEDGEGDGEGEGEGEQKVEEITVPETQETK